MDRGAQMILFQYGIGALLAAGVASALGEVGPGLEFLRAAGVGEFGGVLAAYFVSCYAGIAFLFALVRDYDIVVATGVTGARKAVSLALSLIVFPKRLSAYHVLGGACVGLGLYGLEAQRRVDGAPERMLRDAVKGAPAPRDTSV